MTYVRLRILAATLLALIVVSLVFDVIGDLSDGAAFSHVAMEVGSGFVALGLLAWAVADVMALRRAQVGLERRLDEVLAENARFIARSREAATRLRADIHDQLLSWGLTPAERDVALMIMRGFSFKDVASARGTSERTARAQGLAVYQKAGVHSARELTAFFLDEVLKPDPDFAESNPKR